MIIKEKVRTWCVPTQDNKAYYRPFICSGDLSKAYIFLAGINPATQIYPEEMDVDSYVDMLLDYSRFMEFYKSSRLKKGKDEISRTRTGMISFIDYLKKHTRSSYTLSD